MIESINATRAAIEEAQAVVRSEQFVETELVLESAAETASFENPLQIQGELRSADSSDPPFDDRHISGLDQSVDVQTAEDGTFTRVPTDNRASFHGLHFDSVYARHRDRVSRDDRIGSRLARADGTRRRHPRAYAGGSIRRDSQSLGNGDSSESVGR
ncbi:hypothetical protein D8S78_20880 [Natrialba swarupiae]|nr:hypothetical protein [Natrialba swarupiae]